ncbi:hypothetical protein MMC07_005861 [Pseudocyphellaria aurata]|nr:hypothetical protein [Pseudocyphellaria aurata]
MEALEAPQAARIILEAVQQTLDAAIVPLRQLAIRQAGILKLELILRILLTFLPESTDPSLYIDFLHDVLNRSSSNIVDEITSYESEIADKNAIRQVRKLHLLPLADPQYLYEDPVDPFTLFLLHQAHRIDAETGSLPFVLCLIQPFLSHSEHLRTWAISTFLPLLRLDYEYYPYNGPTHSLEAFEALAGNNAIDSLLFEAVHKTDGEIKSKLDRDLRGLVGPWMYGTNTRKRRKLGLDCARTSSVVQYPIDRGQDADGGAQTSSGWAHVNEWLLELSLRDFPRALEVMAQWDGPRDVDYGQWDDDVRPVEEAALQTLTAHYAQAGLAMVYTADDSSASTLEGLLQILHRVAKLMDLNIPPSLTVQNPSENAEISLEFLDTLSRTHLLHNSLLRARNPFTTPTDLSVRLSYLLLESSCILESLGSSLSCKFLAEQSFFGNEADQIAELRKLLYRLQGKPKDQEEWTTALYQIRWLRDWTSKKRGLEQDSSPSLGVFCRVMKTDMEDELLKTLLHSGCYTIAIEIYCKNSPAPISKANLEKTVLSVALACYDGASNGNRTRGGLRKASEMDYFPQSKWFNEVLALLSATHAMSFYSLTLQHGVPFQPVNIRAHKDPISLVGKILDQNAHSYTKLDDLLEIGQNLASAGLSLSIPNHDSVSSGGNTPAQILYVRRRVTAMAIEAALIEEDFDTAYSYVINRLSPPDPLKNPLKTNEPGSLHTSYELNDDISWRAAYQAGCHRPIRQSGPSALRRLEQRMELLSQALLLAPSSALSEVLMVWRQCEEDMASLIAQEAEEEKKWDDRGDRRVPGGFSGDSSPVNQKPREPNRGALNEEAPMGLFDVARGAAAALSKNAFPLRRPRQSGSGNSGHTSHESPLHAASIGGSESGNPTAMDQEGRVRKRDMVSNMVTGGLASGIGWVIGL